MGRRTALAALLMAATWISCGGGGDPEPPAPSPEPAPRYPEGACLVVDEQVILTAEVDRLAAWIALIEPHDTLPSRRRAALTHTILERAALATAYPEARTAGRARAEGLLADLAGGLDPTADLLATHDPGARLGVVEGTWDDVGLVPWGEAREAGPAALGSWLGPFEEPGRWVLLRALEHVPGKAPGADLCRIDLVTLPFVPTDLTRADVEATIDDARLELADPAWREIVPAAWRLRMNGPD